MSHELEIALVRFVEMMADIDGEEIKPGHMTTTEAVKRIEAAVEKLKQDKEPS